MLPERSDTRYHLDSKISTVFAASTTIRIDAILDYIISEARDNRQTLLRSYSCRYWTDLDVLQELNQGSQYVWAKIMEYLSHLSGSCYFTLVSSECDRMNWKEKWLGVKCCITRREDNMDTWEIIVQSEDQSFTFSSCRCGDITGSHFYLYVVVMVS